MKNVCYDQKCIEKAIAYISTVMHRYNVKSIKFLGSDREDEVIIEYSDGSKQVSVWDNGLELSEFLKLRHNNGG